MTYSASVVPEYETILNAKLTIDSKNRLQNRQVPACKEKRLSKGGTGVPDIADLTEESIQLMSGRLKVPVSVPQGLKSTGTRMPRRH